MALKESNMMDLGTKAPSFNLIDTISDKETSYDDIRGAKGTLVYFTCNHCPFVIHVNDEILRIAHEFIDLGIGVVAISSNDIVNYPQDAPDKMKVLAEELKFPYPYLYDESQEVAKAYDAACTPDFYLFDENDLLYYRGRLDMSRPGNDIPVNGVDLRNAIDQLMKMQPAPEAQHPSAGCNIKWK